MPRPKVCDQGGSRDHEGATGKRPFRNHGWVKQLHNCLFVTSPHIHNKDSLLEELLGLASAQAALGAA
jgi:hypothetical protein